MKFHKPADEDFRGNTQVYMQYRLLSITKKICNISCGALRAFIKLSVLTLGTGYAYKLLVFNIKKFRPESARRTNFSKLIICVRAFNTFKLILSRFLWIHRLFPFIKFFT